MLTVNETPKLLAKCLTPASFEGKRTKGGHFSQVCPEANPYFKRFR